MRNFRDFANRLGITLIGSFAVLPVESFGVPMWTTATGNVTKIYSHEGRHFIKTGIADAPCGIAGYFWWPTSDIDAKDMFALALSAYLAGKRVRVVHDSAASNCDNGGNLATHLAIED
jgi:hypothetical protein